MAENQPTTQQLLAVLEAAEQILAWADDPDYDRTDEAPDLDSLRSLPRFEAILAKMR